MNSLQNFDRSLDKFLAWLSEAESSMEGLETEADRLVGRRDQIALRRPQHQLKVSFCLSFLLFLFSQFLFGKYIIPKLVLHFKSLKQRNYTSTTFQYKASGYHNTIR